MPQAETDRAQTNRANAQHSTGPRTVAGKQRSSQNAFQHGLYSKQLVLPNEDPDEFDRLRSTLRREHQPANTTEEILVDELAQHFWRMRRFREIEARAWQPESDWLSNNMLALITRSLASAERSFFRSLTALTKLQKARGFVPQQSPAIPAATEDAGFVPPSAEEFLAEHALDESALCLHRPDFHFVSINQPGKPSKKTPIAA